MIKQDDLQAIRKLLPLNYAKLIRERLKEKGSEYSLSYIVKVIIGIRECDPILAEAVALAEETKRKKMLLKKKINSLKS